ncbi:hypothetical protein EBU95_20590 [bacterium]|nr:hypothetical protein [bacterium]
MQFDHLIENLLQGLATGKTEQQIADKHGVSVEDVMRQLEVGTEVEMEHTTCPKVARQIASDHLWEGEPGEGINYYKKLKKLGL